MNLWDQQKQTIVEFSILKGGFYMAIIAAKKIISLGENGGIFKCTVVFS